MLGLPPSVRIHFATALVDMRNGIDGLRAIVEGALKKDLYQGHLFVFIGKSKDKVKILFWDRNAAELKALYERLGFPRSDVVWGGWSRQRAAGVTEGA